MKKTGETFKNLYLIQTLLKNIWNFVILSVIKQKGKSHNEGFMKTKHAKFSKKQNFLNPWHAHVRVRILNDRSQNVGVWML